MVLPRVPWQGVDASTNASIIGRARKVLVTHWYIYTNGPLLTIGHSERMKKTNHLFCTTAVL